MKVLLISMPDTMSAFDNLVEYPNTGLCSIAGNLQDWDVRVLDLIACRKKITKSLVHQLNDFEPDVVGLSAMTFQFASALKTAKIVRDWRDSVPIVLGGYHSTLNYREIGESPEAELFDFLIRGEGESAFSGLCEILRRGRTDFSAVPDLSFRQNGTFVHNLPGPLADLSTLNPPNRQARVFDNFSFLGLPFDCIETSRGCVMNCNFCSITKMYGKVFRKFPLDFILSQLMEMKKAGKRGIFFVDDNITLDPKWLREISEGIIDHDLDDLHFVMQASVNGIARDLSLAPLLARAGFRIVFLGIESGSQQNLDALGKGYSSHTTKKVVGALHEAGIAVVGGFIVGNPGDKAEDIKEVFRFAREVGADHSFVQCLTPYPKTAVRELLKKEGLITNGDNFELYNGFIANVRTRHLSSLQIARALVKGGIPYYNNPGAMKNSLLWRYARSSFHKFLGVNIRFIFSGWKNRMFQSTHKF